MRSDTMHGNLRVYCTCWCYVGFFTTIYIKPSNLQFDTAIGEFRSKSCIASLFTIYNYTWFFRWVKITRNRRRISCMIWSQHEVLYLMPPHFLQLHGLPHSTRLQLTGPNFRKTPFRWPLHQIECSQPFHSTPCHSSNSISMYRLHEDWWDLGTVRDSPLKRPPKNHNQAQVPETPLGSKFGFEWETWSIPAVAPPYPIGGVYGSSPGQKRAWQRSWKSRLERSWQCGQVVQQPALLQLPNQSSKRLH